MKTIQIATPPNPNYNCKAGIVEALFKNEIHRHFLHFLVPI
ncbi:MAG: hypothetical protein ABI045_01960 [Flavobacteriales bacterium]